MVDGLDREHTRVAGFAFILNFGQRKELLENETGILTWDTMTVVLHP
jgi:hypothetical protein